MSGAPMAVWMEISCSWSTMRLRIMVNQCSGSVMTYSHSPRRIRVQEPPGEAAQMTRPMINGAPSITRTTGHPRSAGTS
jgi:hypothetical protein